MMAWRWSTGSNRSPGGLNEEICGVVTVPFNRCQQYRGGVAIDGLTRKVDSNPGPLSVGRRSWLVRCKMNPIFRREVENRQGESVVACLAQACVAGTADC